MNADRFFRDAWRVLTLRTCIGIIPALALFVISCGDLTSPQSGSVTLTVTISGEDLDDDGYHLVVDGQLRDTIVTPSTTRWVVPPGERVIALEDVADNCTVEGGSSRTVSVESGRDAAVNFTVVCDATGIRVTVRPTGLEVAATFHLQIEGQGSRELQPGVPLIWSRLAPGQYTLSVVGLTSSTHQCDVPGGAQVTVSVTNRALLDVDFEITCRSTTGDVEVTVVTTGQDTDDTYRLVAGGITSFVGGNSVRLFSSVAAGAHTAELLDIQSNCTVVGSNPRSFELSAGGTVRDTARVRFEVTCARAQKIAYVSNGSIAVALADGSVRNTFFSGSSPSWSPDGTHLVYAWCDWWYYYDCVGLRILDPTTRQDYALGGTLAGVGAHPAWSPDGESIAFLAVPPGATGLGLLIQPWGSSTPVVLQQTLGVMRGESAPSWSPDGTRLAFSCVIVPDQSDICVINRDGSGLTQITNDTWNDFHPDWSPDGQLIAYARSGPGVFSEIILVSPSGASSRRLTAGQAPAFSPDGSKILFSWVASTQAGQAARPSGLFVTDLQGTTETRVTTGFDIEPAWRP